MSWATPTAPPFFEPRHLELEQQALALCREGAIESEHDPRLMAAALAKAGLFRACVPAGGGGLRERVELRDLCLVRSLLAYHSTLADLMFGVQGLGSFPITLAGDAAQRQALLPSVASGERLCAFALTEPEAGSDVSAVSTRAVRDGDGYLLDGSKCFISSAGVADQYVVFARTGPDSRGGLSAFVVAAGAPGLTSEPQQLLGDHPIGRLHFRGCRVPASARLGAEGDGFELALATLEFFRASVGAAAVGMAARALHETVRRVQERRQFGRALAEFQATQMALAEMGIELEAARLLVHQAARHVDLEPPPHRRQASMAKLYATEAAFRIVDRALQLHGGHGLEAGGVLERLYREVRALRIYEGTSEIQKLIIAKAMLAGS